MSDFKVIIGCVVILVFLVVVAVLALEGYNGHNQAENQSSSGNSTNLINNLTIVEHPATGLCFMTGWYRDGSTELSTGGPVVVLIPSHYCGDRDLPPEGNDRLSK